jgi:hypothetical protein
LVGALDLLHESAASGSKTLVLKVVQQSYSFQHRELGIARFALKSDLALGLHIRVEEVELPMNARPTFAVQMKRIRR